MMERTGAEDSGVICEGGEIWECANAEVGSAKSGIWERRTAGNLRERPQNLESASICHGEAAQASCNSAYHHIFDRVYLVASDVDDLERKSNSEFAYFTIKGVLSYVGFSDDFGPMSLGTVFQFCNILDSQLNANPNKTVVMVTDSESESVTNAVFLMGAYMIMKLNIDIDSLMDRFELLIREIVPYRDVSPGKQNFDLHIEDCWGGLYKAKMLGWVDFRPDCFDPVQYATYDDPLNADLHEIVPGKFVAMRGPRTLRNRESWEDVRREDGDFSHRDFSPSHYVETLHQLDVKTVVRLNAPEYDKGEFVSAGIAVADLFFPDCTSPSPAVIAKFMAIAEAVPGAIAVHCKAGLGRTGTLIGLYLMKNYGFTAREAIGWIRIVRPGSVIGTQQHFLCDKEPLLRRRGAGASGSAAGARGRRLPAHADTAAIEKFVASTVEHVDRQVLLFRRRKEEGCAPRGAGGGAAWEAAAKDAAADAARLALAAHVAAAAERRNGLRAAAVATGSPAARLAADAAACR